MRRAEMMTAGGVTLAGLGALVGLAIGSGEGTPKALVPRAQPVEVRTEVIRKTVNVYRREHPHRVAGTGGHGSSGASVPKATGALSAATRTRSSGARAVSPTASAAPVVSTRSSGGRSSSGAGTGARSPGGGSRVHTVKTRTSGSRTSGSHGGGGSHAGGGSSGGGSGSRPVRTATSGGGSSSGAARGGSGSRPVGTRSSGGGERSDRGGGHDD